MKMRLPVQPYPEAEMLSNAPRPAREIYEGGEKRVIYSPSQIIPKMYVTFIALKYFVILPPALF